MGHTCGEIKMASYSVIAMFALMSSCVATAGELHNTGCRLIIFFWIYFSSFSSVWKKFRKCDVYAKRIYVLQGNKIFDYRLHSMFAHVTFY